MQDSQQCRFDDDDVKDALQHMTAADIDRLPFGAIQVDRVGTILFYNTVESLRTGLKAEDVLGKNFFQDIAPCTRSPLFYGRFVDGVRSGRLDVVFEYTFNYKIEPADVKVHMIRAAVGDTYWITVRWS